MAITVNVCSTCDRCMKPFDEERLDYGEPLPEKERVELILIRDDVQVFKFQDLCPSCVGVVDKCIKRLRLESDDKKENGVSKNKQAEHDQETTTHDF